MVLSDYPAAGQLAHAIGLDTIESAVEIVSLLREAGYDVADDVSSLDLVAALCDGAPPAVSRSCGLSPPVPDAAG